MLSIVYFMTEFSHADKVCDEPAVMFGSSKPK